MANDIYTTTRDGLADLVSPKAATQLLERALKAKGFRPESVSRQEMKSVLLGPVIRELEGILPKMGVERNLRRIYMSLPRSGADVSRRARRVVSSPEVLSSPPQEDPDESVAAFDIDVDIKAQVDASQTDALNLDPSSSAPRLSELALAAARVDALTAAAPQGTSDAFGAAPKWDAADAAAESEDALTPAARAPEDIPTVPSSAPISSAPTSSAPARRLVLSGEDELSEVVLKFAKLENARMVMGMRATGEIILSRGSAEDLDAIARLGALALKLLSRSGEIRSYYLAHSQLQLFLFPLGDYAVTVIGTHDLNLGEVFSTLSMLEEDV